MKKSRFELAPQEKQKLVEPIQGIFLEKVFGIEGALITDESYLSDFNLYPKDRALRQGARPGALIFSEKRYIGPRFSLAKDPGRWHEERRKPENWAVEEVEIDEPGMSKTEIIQKVKAVFGVDISTVYDLSLVDILLYVAENFKR